MILAVLVTTGLLLLGIIAVRAGLQQRVERSRKLSGQRQIDESGFQSIGGIPQAVQVRGNDSRNPLLLYLHGGPGLPMMPFAHAFQHSWEKHFTVVHWDQRNTGRTLARNGPEKGLTLHRHVEDGIELAGALQARFPDVPLVLLGHSWGTAIAIEMLRAQPEAFAAYLAIGQVSDFLTSERYGYETVIEEARRRNATGLLKALERYPGYPAGSSLAAAINTVRSAEMQLGFAHHSDKLIMLKLLCLAFQSPEYSWRDLRSLLNKKAQGYSLALALRELPIFNARAAGSEIACPVVMVGGSHDLFTPTPMARAFFDQLRAPCKEFIEVEGMAHFGPLENSAAISDVVGRLNSLIATRKPL